MGDNTNPQPDCGATASSDDLLARVGQVTRTLHDSLRALGLDKVIQDAARDIPDVRDRLNYVVSMTEQAAQRVLSATETAIPLQENIAEQSRILLAQYRSSPAAQQGDLMGIASSLFAIANNADITKQQLIDIMMAQDFQDLTGQVIRRITDLAHELESQLVQLLKDYAPTEIRRETHDTGLLNGPQIHAHAEDVVSDQGQVDDLLSSLGF